jgi:hypothetical protein
MVFGELQAKLHRLDLHDPATSEIRGPSAADVAVEAIDHWGARC